MKIAADIILTGPITTTKPNDNTTVVSVPQTMVVVLKPEDRKEILILNAILKHRGPVRYVIDITGETVAK